MPARSLKAAPDAELQNEIKALKVKVSDLGSENINLNKKLGAAAKDQQAYADLQGAHKALGDQLKAAQAEIAHLRADLDSARAKGSSDAQVLAAAKQIADGIKKLG